MAISKVLKKAKPKTKPKVKPKPKPKKKLSPMMKKLEVQRIKSDKFSEADAKRLLKYDDDLRDVLFKEAFRDLKATGGRVKPSRRLNLKKMSEAMRKVTGKGRKRRAGPDRPKPGARRPRLLPRAPKDRMVLPPRPRKNPTPRVPKTIQELTPEQRRRIMQLVKKGRRKTRPTRRMK